MRVTSAAIVRKERTGRGARSLRARADCHWASLSVIGFHAKVKDKLRKRHRRKKEGRNKERKPRKIRRAHPMQPYGRRQFDASGKGGKAPCHACEAREGEPRQETRDVATVAARSACHWCPWSRNPRGRKTSEEGRKVGRIAAVERIMGQNRHTIQDIGTLWKPSHNPGRCGGFCGWAIVPEDATPGRCQQRGNAHARVTTMRLVRLRQLSQSVTIVSLYFSTFVLWYLCTVVSLNYSTFVLLVRLY